MDTTQLLQKFNSFTPNTLMETLQIEFVAIGDDFLTAKMPVTSKVHQPYGILHGGATAALVETVGSSASAFFTDTQTQIVKGLELSINHVKSKKEGWIWATARPIHRGKTTHLWEVKVVDEEDNLISVAKITNIILSKK